MRILPFEKNRLLIFDGKLAKGKPAGLLIPDHNLPEDIRHTRDIDLLHYQQEMFGAKDMAAMQEAAKH